MQIQVNPFYNGSYQLARACAYHGIHTYSFFSKMIYRIKLHKYQAKNRSSLFGKYKNAGCRQPAIE
ncbi:MAG: hypothetical protein ABS68_01520 [Niastella sp. SCN 39-18]|nr:MAG: hypothetical protein ABS68_01520 [Niastella sp. SCN 39-18]OJW10746.1 MAG: hypothetical protein BGO53_14290 [Sphingobacteriales bacterium 39-19]